MSKAFVNLIPNAIISR